MPQAQSGAPTSAQSWRVSDQKLGKGPWSAELCHWDPSRQQAEGAAGHAGGAPEPAYSGHQ